MAALGHAAVFVLLGWAVASYFITSAIMGRKKHEESDPGFFASIGYTVKFFVVLFIVFVVPFWLLSILLK
jgi:hypothetical protein